MCEVQTVAFRMRKQSALVLIPAVTVLRKEPNLWIRSDVFALTERMVSLTVNRAYVYNPT